MKQCIRCNINILDETEFCPLCQSQLQEIQGIKCKNEYPLIPFNKEQYNITKRLFLFLSIIVGLLLIIINYVTYKGIMWSVISTAIIIYFWIIMSHSLKHNINLGAKIFVQTLCLSVLVLVIDYIWDYTGWSVNYAIPNIILFSNYVLVALMLIKYKKVRKYILYQSSLFLLSLVLLILIWRGIITHPLFSLITVLNAFLSFLGTVIFADRVLKNELIRRFHV